LGHTTRLAAALLVAAAGAVWSDAVIADSPATQVATFHLNAPLARVFRMFTVLGEREWAQGWEPVLLSGSEDRGTAFRTRSHADQEVIWIVSDFQPSKGVVSYARVVQGSNVGLVDVSCAHSHGGTDVTVRYTLTALSADAKASVDKFLDPGQFAQMIEEWRSATAAALDRSGPSR
jgi:hypothetical protein